MGFFYEIWYRLKLGCWIFNYEVSTIVNAIVEDVLSQEWVDFKVTQYHVTIKTKSGKVFEFWNANKYYAWVSRGSYQTGEKQYSWSDERPSTRLLLSLKGRITKEIINEYVLYSV